MGKLTKHFSLLLTGVLAAWGLWLAEVCWIKGWDGLAWLSGFNWSALPICALILITASYGVSARASWRERIIFTAVGWVIALVAFVLARWAAFDLLSRGLGLLPRVRWEPFIAAALAGLLVSAGLTFAANRWLAAMHYWTGFLIAAGLLLVMPLSIATIKIFPALNGSMDEIDSIKMGYPVFWTAVLVPVALCLGRKRRPTLLLRDRDHRARRDMSPAMAARRRDSDGDRLSSAARSAPDALSRNTQP
jgi:hypothetical protein